MWFGKFKPNQLFLEHVDPIVLKVIGARKWPLTPVYIILNDTLKICDEEGELIIETDDVDVLAPLVLVFSGLGAKIHWSPSEGHLLKIEFREDETD